MEAGNDEHEITLGGAAFKLAQLKDKIKGCKCRNS